MPTRSTRLAALVGVTAVVATACGSGSSDEVAASSTVPTASTSSAPTTTAAPSTTAAPATTTTLPPGPMLALSFDGLEPLGDSAEYEGWLIVDGEAISTGRFDVADGGLVDDEGNAVDSFAITNDAATAVVITIEPEDDPDPAPSAVHILAGDLVDGAAELTVGHPAAIGTDFAGAAGSFLLGTPTNGNGNDELSGVWFLSIPGSVPSLDLPELPAGWVYEGWAVIDGQPVTTGRFTDPTMADDFDGFSGDQGGPNTPGEDFIVNPPDGLAFPTSLIGSTIVISVEPDPDNSPAPFTLKPLVATVAEGTADHVNLPFSAGPPAPTGAATIG